jgi:hypothetical protein
MCKEGFEKDKEGKCMPKPVPEGVYGAIPGVLQQRLSSTPSGDCSEYVDKKTCNEQYNKCAWYRYPKNKW